MNIGLDIAATEPLVLIGTAVTLCPGMLCNGFVGRGAMGAESNPPDLHCRTAAWEAGLIVQCMRYESVTYKF